VRRSYKKKSQLDALISEIYFWNKNLHVSDSSSVHHREFFTGHTAMVYVSKPVWHISLLCVQWKTADGGQRNCPKHVEFYSKNKIEKLEHLFGLIREFVTMRGHLWFKKHCVRWCTEYTDWQQKGPGSS